MANSTCPLQGVNATLLPHILKSTEYLIKFSQVENMFSY